jgi:hypothetical protein
MKKGSFISLPVIALFILGIIGIFLVVPIIIDAYNHIVHGNCWADMQETVSDIKSDLNSISLSSGESRKSTYKSITVGECVGAVIVFNRAPNDNYESSSPNLARFQSIIKEKCPTKLIGEYDGYKSFILVLPWKTVKQELEQQETLWESIKEKVTWKYYQDLYKEGYEYIRFLKPTCTGLEATFQNSEYFLPPELANVNSPMNEKDVKMCYELSKIASTGAQGFSYHLQKAADSQCP